jgi:hypothetical protein
MKKQAIILAAALWGVVPFLLGYIRELGEDGIIPMFDWLQSVLGIIMVLLHWAYFLPAFAVTFVLRIPLYAPMIVLLPTNPANPATWILPVVCWFGLINAGLLITKRMKARRSNKALHASTESRANAPSSAS